MSWLVTWQCLTAVPLFDIFAYLMLKGPKTVRQPQLNSQEFCEIKYEQRNSWDYYESLSFEEYNLYNINLLLKARVYSEKFKKL